MISKLPIYFLLIMLVANMHLFAGAAGSEGRSNTVGEIRIATILITFFDGRQNSAYINANPEMSPQAYREFLFESPHSFSAFIKENSYGKTWLSGEVFGPFEIPVDSPSEDNRRSCRVFDEVVAATDATIDFSRFDIILIIYPRAKDANGEFVNFCEFQGTSGGRSDYAYDDGVLSHDVIWINGFVNLHILAHELGHLMGLGHANAWKPDPQKRWPYTYGEKLETGDPYSVMGYGSADGYTGPGHFSASEKDTLGWFESHNVLNIREPGIYNAVLAPLENRSEGIQTIKIKINQRMSYYLEYRRALGFDAHLENVDGLFVLRTGPGMSGYETNRFYTSLQGNRFVLPSGESLTDIRNKLRIKTLHMAQNGIAVEIAFGAPNLVISTPDFVWPRQVVRGDTVAIPFVIENTGVADIRHEFDVALSISTDAGSERMLLKRLTSLRKQELRHLQFHWIVENKSESVMLQLVVDHKNEIEELNKDDNCAPRRFGVRVHLRDAGDVATETGNEKFTTQPGQTALMANYPNPFNANTTIRYQLKQQHSIELAIFNSTGQRVRTLLSGIQPAGEHAHTWDGRDDHNNGLSSGVYICSLLIHEGDELHAHNRRLTLLR